MQMHFILYTARGNIEDIGNYLRRHDLMLKHPTPPFDNDCRLHTYPYYNPHNPAPRGYPRHIIQNRYHAPGPTIGKTQDIQRTQIDELFKSLTDGIELPETEPGISLLITS